MDGMEKERLMAAKEMMVEEHLKGRGIAEGRVLEAMRAVERERFVGEDYQAAAYADGPLPIGFGQTISQPYIVALMTEKLEVGAYDEVLEIGTGCGYQTAVLAKLCRWVYTVERVEELSREAQRVLGEMGIRNVSYRVGDGSEGWPGDRQFGRIMVTAAVPSPPLADAPLAEQLAEGGRMVVPVGVGERQELRLVEKVRGRVRQIVVCPVRFVPLVGKYGFGDG